MNYSTDEVQDGDSINRKPLLFYDLVEEEIIFGYLEDVKEVVLDVSFLARGLKPNSEVKDDIKGRGEAKELEIALFIFVVKLLEQKHNKIITELDDEDILGSAVVNESLYFHFRKIRGFFL